MNYVKRVVARLHCARRFSNQGQSWIDRIKLGLVGLARNRPFGGSTFYGRLTQPFAFIQAKIRSNTGLQLDFDLTDFVDTMIFEELVIDHIYPLERVPFEPDLVIDAGTCRGLFTLLARDRFPNANSICIEPESTNVERLRSVLENNSLSAEVIVGAVAVGRTSVSFAGEGFGGSITNDGANSNLVPGIDLLHLIERHSSSKLLLKIDIEGEEATTLPTIVDSLPETCAICLETHHSRLECEGYLAGLDAAGFNRSEIRSRPVEQGDSEYIEWFFLRSPTG